MIHWGGCGTARELPLCKDVVEEDESAGIGFFVAIGIGSDAVAVLPSKAYLDVALS